MFGMLKVTPISEKVVIPGYYFGTYLTADQQNDKDKDADDTGKDTKRIIQKEGPP